MELGVIIPLNNNLESEFEKVAQYGFSTCQLNCWDDKMFTDDYADRIIKASEKYKIRITAFWCGWKGPAVWDFYEGPLTLGLIPTPYRWDRMKMIIAGADFAKKFGVTDVITHVGFLPENPKSIEYSEIVAALKLVAEHLKNNGQYFLFETGQETPVTLRRTIEDIGTNNLGINLDPANLILYGKANPVDALDVFGKYVRGIHGKDGCYPTDGKHLGEEKPIGGGKVNYPMFIQKLQEIGYTGAITIEREISGEKQREDILAAKQYLTELI